jgi:hypothetical protein
MRAPAHKRNTGEIKRDTNEIVADIMGILGAPAVEVLVRKLIDDLRANCPSFIGNRNVNNEYLKDLSAQITKFKKLLRSAPAPLRTALFSPEFFGPLYERQGTALGINPKLRNYLAQKPKRLTYLVEALDWLQAQSNQIRSRGLGMHGGVDYQKLSAAIARGDVLENAAALYRERKLSFSCSRTSDYHRIASLFYEAATGEYGCDLRRQCKMAAPAPSQRTK